MRVSRRFFLGLTALGALGAGYSFWVEPQWLRLTKYAIRSPKWPENAKPLRIAYASDFHTGCPSVGLEETAHIVKRLNALNADIILLGGDFLIKGVLFGKYKSPQDIAPLLSKLTAPLGVYAVLGNHDWWEDGEGMWRALENAGIRVLENSALPVAKNGHSFWVAGMADDTTRHPDYAATMTFVTDGRPVIMMAHDPVSFSGVSDRAVITVCGHTHGGQVVIPGVAPLIMPGRAPRKYAYGHIEEEGRDLIVSSGIGTSILPVRFGRRPEIVLIELEHGAGERAA